MYSWIELKPFVPWVITTVSLGYVLYVSHKLRHFKTRFNLDPDHFKRKHVLKGENLEKEILSTDKSGATSKSKIEKASETSNSEVSRPRSRKSAYSYFVEECSEREVNHLCHTTEERLIFAEFAKKCAHSWKKLTPEEKQHYHRLSELDKNRYDKEMKIYRELTHKKPHKRRRTRNNSNENESNDDYSRRQSAFDLFAKQEMTVIRELMPNINNEQMLNQLIKRWNSCGDDVKNKFRSEAQIDQTNGRAVDGEEEEEEDISAGDNNDSDNVEEVDDEVDEDCGHSKSSKV